MVLMRTAIVAMVLVAMLIPQQAPALAQESPDSVRILVPTDKGRARSQSARSRQIGWKRVEVQLSAGNRQDRFDEALASAAPGAIIEMLYTLDGPEDEPRFDEQWSFENVGQTGGTSDADVDAVTAWNQSTGTGVVVAVIDSGIDPTHPDLVGQFTSATWDTVDEDSDPSPEGTGSSNAHGTMVAGVLAAAVNGSGITGLAPTAKIMNLRACSDGDCWSLDIAEAIYFAVQEGADIINLSLGSPGVSDPPMEEAIAYARASGAMVVAAIGNDGINTDNLSGGEIMIPADLPFDNIISVAASDDRDLRASFSNYGPSSVDLFAPGDAVLTTGAAGLDPYVLASGTSFAAPLVSATAALLLASDPGISYHELIARIIGFADSPGGLGGLSKHGRVNAGTTLTMRFIDTSGSIFVNAIDWLAQQEITEGCNPPQNHKYCPSQNVTRGEMAVFYARSFGLPLTNVDFFNDDNGRFYEGAANRLAAAGITVGCGGGRYCGDRDITREEMAAMLSRALSLPETAQDYFIDDEGSIFEGAINRIAEAQITQGCNPPINDRFCPLDDVTRGEMAAFLKRAVQKLTG